MALLRDGRGATGARRLHSVHSRTLLPSEGREWCRPGRSPAKTPGMTMPDPPEATPLPREQIDESAFRLLVEGVRDYAIYMLDPAGRRDRAGTAAPSASRATRPTRSSAAISRASTARRTAPPACRRARSTPRWREGRFEGEGWRVRKDGTPLLGACRHRSDPRCRRACCSASPRSRATSPSGARPRRRCAAARSSSACWCRASPTTRIYMLDPEGRVATWNAGAQRIKGYAPEEIIGQHFSRFYTEEDRAAGEPQRALDTAAREGRFEKEGWRVRKDGTRFWANVVIDAIRDDDGTLHRLRQDHARHHRAARGRSSRWSGRARRCSSRRRWRRSASSPAASRTTSTTC